MRFNRILLMTLAAAAISLTTANSCKKVKHETQYVTYMTAVSDKDSADKDNSGISYLVSDDSIKIFPGNSVMAIGRLKHNDRIFATFTIPSGEITDPIAVEFTSFSLLPQDSIITSSRIDTLGNDPINVHSAWHSGGIYGAGRFLTLGFTYKGLGTMHSFSLVEDTGANGNPDADGYYNLYLRHNSYNDAEAYTYEGIITYPLTDKYTSSGIKGLKIRFQPQSTSSDNTIVVNFQTPYI